MPSSKTKSTYQKRQRRILRYDLDFAPKQVLFRIDLILEDTQNNLPTPVTPLYQARLEVWEKAAAVIKRNFDPRELNCCFIIENSEVRRTVYVPHLPGTIEHVSQVQETLVYTGITNAIYNGESHNNNYRADL